MKIIRTLIPEVVLLEPEVFGDSRGFFLETYSASKYKNVGIDGNFVQDNHSRSGANILRGLHYQLKHPQGKLVRVARGRVFDVALDIRLGSKTFGMAVWAELSDENMQQLYIPPGFAHGFCVLSDYADFEYKCTDYYHPDDEGGISWNDPELNIPWPTKSPVVSDKDSKYFNLSDISHANLPVFTT